MSKKVIVLATSNMDRVIGICTVLPRVYDYVSQDSQLTPHG